MSELWVDKIIGHTDPDYVELPTKLVTDLSSTIMVVPALAYDSNTNQIACTAELVRGLVQGVGFVLVNGLQDINASGTISLNINSGQYSAYLYTYPGAGITVLNRGAYLLVYDTNTNGLLKVSA